MLISLFTDAGFCPKAGIGTYAVWAKANGRTIRKSGVLKSKQDGSDLAELRALVNGVAFVVSMMRPPIGSRIIAQTDCLSAISAVTGQGYRNKKARERVADTLAFLQRTIEAGQLRVEYRHVKGHKGNVSPRNAVNSWCDAECTRHLQTARARDQISFAQSA